MPASNNVLTNRNLLEKILKYLPNRSLASAARVSKQTRSVAQPLIEKSRLKRINTLPRIVKPLKHRLLIRKRRLLKLVRDDVNIWIRSSYNNKICDCNVWFNNISTAHRDFTMNVQIRSASRDHKEYYYTFYVNKVTNGVRLVAYYYNRYNISSIHYQYNRFIGAKVASSMFRRIINVLVSNEAISARARSEYPNNSFDINTTKQLEP